MTYVTYQLTLVSLELRKDKDTDHVLSGNWNKI